MELYITDFGRELSKLCVRAQDAPSDILEQRRPSAPSSLGQTKHHSTGSVALEGVYLKS